MWTRRSGIVASSAALALQRRCSRRVDGWSHSSGSKVSGSGKRWGSRLAARVRTTTDGPAATGTPTLELSGVTSRAIAVPRRYRKLSGNRRRCAAPGASGSFPGVMPAREAHAPRPRGRCGFSDVPQAQAGIAMRADGHRRALVRNQGAQKTHHCVHLSEGVNADPNVKTGMIQVWDVTPWSMRRIRVRARVRRRRCVRSRPPAPAPKGGLRPESSIQATPNLSAHSGTPTKVFADACTPSTGRSDAR
jgi:hypothetical protein